MQICDPVLRYRKSGFLYNGRIFRGKAYGLTEEETEKLAELVKEKVKTQYLDKYEIDPASFTFPEYEPIAERTEAKDLWDSAGLELLTQLRSGDNCCCGRRSRV